MTGAGLLAAGCSSEEPVKSAPKPAPAAADPETVLRKRSAAASRALLGQYDAVLARHPVTARLLRPMREAVAAHVQALSPVRTPAARVPAAPADRASAVKALIAAERRTAGAHTASLDAAPAELARLLASVAAAGEVHAYLLTEGNR